MNDDLLRVQYAALPFRIVDGRPQILLVTTRETGRWIIPKGWPKPTVKPHDMAAREAYEEAGITGRVFKRVCGSYRSTKRLADGETVPCEVQVFPFEVRQELEEWPERGQRRRLWVALEDAAGIVQEAGLAELLRNTTLPPAK